MARLRSFASLLPLCAALAACADGVAGRDAMAPDARPTLPAAALVDESALPLASSAGHARVAHAPHATRGAAASSRRVTGHAEMTYLSSRQAYSFTAFSIGQVPPTKGLIHVSIVNPRVTIEIDARVDCLLALGDEAWVSGPVERFVLNGVEYSASIHLVVRVQDNGEGPAASLDGVSPPFSGGPQACLDAPALPLLRNGAGNVQLAVR